MTDYNRGIDAITGNTSSGLSGSGGTGSSEFDFNQNGGTDDPAAEPEISFGVESWLDNLFKQMLGELKATGDAMGEDPYIMGSFLETNWEGLKTYLDETLFAANPGVAPEILLQDRSTLLQASMGARLYLQSKWSDLGANWNANTSSGGRSGGGGGRSSLPTEQEIRQQFDVDQLAAQAQNTWRGILFDELEDPRTLARSYIDAVVKSGAQQKIDFQTFVETKATSTARYAAIYKSKPEGMTRAQFIQPYMQAAQQVIGANDQAVSSGLTGAMTGASADSFQAQLNRTDAVTGSTNFINGMEARLTDLRKVFRE